MSEDATKFTLRFHSRRTHKLLGIVADEFGVSKNRLAEQMLERELEAAGLLVANDLDGTVRQLREYGRDERLDADIQAFAEAEAHAEDPLQARMVEPAEKSHALGDDYGVLEAFNG